VTDSPTANPEKPRAAVAARIGWAVLIVATLYVCYFSHLGAIGFVGPDEPRYAWIARAMVETGDWVTPRLYDQPWFEKPALLYWMTATGFKSGLGAELAPRLPAMCGKATFAMEVSSTSMNVASVTVSAMIHGLTAGGTYARSAGSAAAAASLI